MKITSVQRRSLGQQHLKQHQQQEEQHHHPIYTPRLVATYSSGNNGHPTRSIQGQQATSEVDNKKEKPSSTATTKCYKHVCLKLSSCYGGKRLRYALWVIVLASIFVFTIGVTVRFILIRKAENINSLRRLKHGITINGDSSTTTTIKQGEEEDEMMDHSEMVWVPNIGWTHKTAVHAIVAEAKIKQAEEEARTGEGPIGNAIDSKEIAEKGLLTFNWGNPVSIDVDNMDSIFNDGASSSSSETLPSYLQRELNKAIKFRETLRRYYHSTNGEGDSSQPVRVKVTGQKSIVKRDLPLMQRGFVSVATSAFTFANPNLEEARMDDSNLDLLLCLSLSSCARKDDIFTELFENNPGARVNRVPNLRGVLWSKQNFCKTIPEWLAMEIAFPCWIVPEHIDQLINHVSTRPADEKWIMKPWASGGGNGITVATGIEELRETIDLGKNLVVQPFLADPLLINGRKIDLRLYVLLTSTYPVRAYIHERGLVRFASQVYHATTDNRSSRGQFLTNTSVNKKESNATAAELTWSFKSLYEAIGPARSRRTRLGIDRAVALVLLASESKFPRRAGCDIADGACYHLLGFDVILPSKEALPRVIEVNGEPSFARATIKNAGDFDHYDDTKIAVARDVAKVVFSPLTNKSRQEAHKLLQKLDEPSFAEYSLELAREQQVISEFRPCYPSPVAAVFEAADESFTRLISADVTRLKLHNTLKLWEQRRLVNCHRDTSCMGGLRSVLDDLIGEGFHIASPDDQQAEDHVDVEEKKP